LGRSRGNDPREDKKTLMAYNSLLLDEAYLSREDKERRPKKRGGKRREGISYAAPKKEDQQQGRPFCQHVS